ncbi:UDP-N-acetylmuramoyl-L-alanyl-D-glutamate--2,6-diaminopimelate ligase [Verrucomicrobiota bacterium]
MKLDTMLKNLRPLGIQGTPQGEAEGVVCDSRQVRDGFVFVAVAGSQCDGRDFADDAFARNAAAVVSEDPGRTRPGECWVRVEDSREALAELSAVFYGRPSSRLRVAGITGTNGKTTVAYMLCSVLEAAGLGAGLISTVEYRIGGRAIPATRTTPEAPLLQSLLAQMVDAGCAAAVIEVSSHALVQKRTVGIEYDVGVMTCLTRDHLDYHGDMESYFEAKRILFKTLGRGGKHATAVINRDDPWGRRLVELGGIAADVLTYGAGPEADVRAVQIRPAEGGSAFQLETPWGIRPVSLQLMGRYNVANALAAAASAGALGIDLDRIAGVLSTVRHVPGRLEEIRNRAGIKVFVDYAHTDDALANVLTTLREAGRGRLVVVFGCGGNRDSSKRPVMGEIASRLADHAIVTSDNPRGEDPDEIIAQVMAGAPNAPNVAAVADRLEAIRRGLDMAQPGDVVLIAGKGHENFQEFANNTVPFDDRQAVRELLDGRL